MTGYRFDKYRYTALIPIALLATCMMVAGYILLDTDRPEYFRLYYLMPFSYGFILVVLLKWHQALMKSWSLTLISALYFIRYVVAPFLTCIGRYETLLGNKACLEYMDLAILLSVYEIFCVALVMWFFLSRNKTKQYTYSVIETKNHRKDAFNTITILLCSFCIAVLVCNPALTANFHLFNNMNAPYPDIELRSWRTLGTASDVPLGILNTALMKIWNVVQLVFPAVIIDMIYRKYHRNSRKAWYLSLIVCALILMVYTQDNAITIWVACSMLLLVFSLYPRQARKTAPFILLLLFAAAMTLLFAKVGNDGSMADLSQTLNAYFTGPINVSAAIAARQELGWWDGLTLFARDTVGGIPLVRRFAGYSGWESSGVFNAAFWGRPDITDQLLTGVGQGVMCFGVVLAPVIPALMAAISLYLDKKAVNTSDIRKRGIFLFFSMIVAFLLGNCLNPLMAYLQLYLFVILMLPLTKVRISIRHNRSVRLRCVQSGGICESS